jgi:hypothetical protein
VGWVEEALPLPGWEFSVTLGEAHQTAQMRAALVKPIWRAGAAKSRVKQKSHMKS